MRTLAVLPVKRFGAAKQRLTDSFDGEERDALARAMLTDVLAALAEVPGLGGVAVVTANPANAVPAGGFTVLPDDAESGHSSAALIGIAHARAEGFDRVLLVPGDAPLLDPAELSDLLADPQLPAVVIVPDRHGSGTNGLLLTPPDAIEPGFGPGSRERHEERAAGAGHASAVVPLSSLVLDVDTFDDLQVVARTLERRDGGAPATRAAIAGLLASR